MSTPLHTIARRVCCSCNVTLGTAVWPYDPLYGETTETHGLCDDCFHGAFDADLDDAGEAA